MKISLNKALFIVNVVQNACLLNLVPISIVFIHQVVLREAVNFFGVVLPACFLYDLGILILFIVFNVILFILEAFKYYLLELTEKGGK